MNSTSFAVSISILIHKQRLYSLQQVREKVDVDKMCESTQPFQHWRQQIGCWKKGRKKRGGGGGGTKERLFLEILDFH